jgi:DNA-binding transcriptional MerR regulator
MPKDYMTIGEVASHFDCQVWQVRRLYIRGLLLPATRIGQNRVVPAKDLPKVEKALRQAGYIQHRAKNQEKQQ